MIELPPNQIRRFYRGGRRIGAFRGLPERSDEAPEDWVASTTTAYGESELGLSRLPDGVLLEDVLARDPARFFEPAHRDRFGSQPLILIKLLDAGERLPVHLHPDDAFAASYLGAPCGKTEAWIILEAEAGAQVHLGFRGPITGDELKELVAAGGVLEELNPIPVAAGDSIFVPAGLPHAIGEGILLLELQQPADLSLLLEGQDFLGLAPDVALAAVDRSPPDLEWLRRGRGTTLFPEEADRFFRAELVAGGTRLDAGYSVLVGHEGDGMAGDVPIRRGSTVLVPFAAGEVELTGSCRAIRCRPPAPGR